MCMRVYVYVYTNFYVASSRREKECISIIINRLAGLLCDYVANFARLYTREL